MTEMFCLLYETDGLRLFCLIGHRRGWMGCNKKTKRKEYVWNFAIIKLAGLRKALFLATMNKFVLDAF